MDHSQQPCQTLDEALRLAVIGATPHGVARMVLMYHQVMYMTVQTFLPCVICLQRGALPEQVKRRAAKLNEQRAYYMAHLDRFGKRELQGLVNNNLSQIDLSSLCDSCLTEFQQQLATAFRDYLVQQGIRYHVRKKRSVPANKQERSSF